MELKEKLSLSDELAQRKGDHIELASRAQTSAQEVDERFNYEPLFFTHPTSTETWPQKFLKKSLDYPLWISSMTGGTVHAKTINENLARLCGTYKLGMGLGSCRSLLTSNGTLKDFAIRKHLGDQPLYANLGLAQIEELIAERKSQLIHDLVKKVEADGLIIHINPLQEWFQPEGDKYKVAPIVTLTKFLEEINYPVLVKEVGQGFGPKSLSALLALPIAGIEFGAFGGTNFSLLESMREGENENKKPFIHVGHTALEMIEILNALPVKEKEFIISGGVRNVLDAYELKMRLKAPGVIGMAGAFLRPALESYESLEKYFLSFRESFLIAKSSLKLKVEK